MLAPIPWVPIPIFMLPPIGKIGGMLTETLKKLTLIPSAGAVELNVGLLLFEIVWFDCFGEEIVLFDAVVLFLFTET